MSCWLFVFAIMESEQLSAMRGVEFIHFGFMNEVNLYEFVNEFGSWKYLMRDY